MVSVKHLILALVVLLSTNLVVCNGFDFLSIIASIFGLNKHQSKPATNPSPSPMLKLVTPTSVCGTPPPSCPTTRYRSLNGSCNNLENPGWGTPNSTYGRLIPSIYGDDGKLTSYASNTTICAPIIIPDNDPIHKAGSCLDFERTITARDIGCAPSDKPGEQLSVVTAYLDASIVYGSSDEQGAAIRAYTKGLMKIVKYNNSKEWPPQVSNVTATCPAAKSSTEPCFLGGDVRINQSPGLTLLQVVWVRYHNKLATEMAKENPHWCDEKLFQEVRRIISAYVQKFTYYDLLPLYLGKDNMLAYKLIYEGKGYKNDYNKTVNPAVSNEYATAAFRGPHTLIAGMEELIGNDTRSTVGFLRLSDHYDLPAVLVKNDTDDKLVRGMTKQPAWRSDRYFDKEITWYLFRYQKKYGTDLRAITIQRGRDHAIASYVSARAAFNLSVPETFEDLNGTMHEDVIEILKKLYVNVTDMDLTVGGLLEIPVPGTLVGPLYLCIILEQLYRTRVGDRFFFENGSDKDIRFEPAQLESIRNVTMSSVLCTASNIKAIQKNAFEQISASNPLVLCDDIPKLNITLWKEEIKELASNLTGEF